MAGGRDTGRPLMPEPVSRSSPSSAVRGLIFVLWQAGSAAGQTPPGCQEPQHLDVCGLGVFCPPWLMLKLGQLTSLACGLPGAGVAVIV